jgi:hypothetical protein
MSQSQMSRKTPVLKVPQMASCPSDVNKKVMLTVLLLLLCSRFKGDITKLILTVLPCADVTLTHNTWHAFPEQKLSVKKEFIKAVVCFIKVAIEQDSVVPSSFMALVTHVRFPTLPPAPPLVNGNTNEQFFR